MDSNRSSGTDIKDLEKLVQQRYFNQAEYHLIAEVNEQGYAHARALDWRGQELFTGSHEDVASSKARTPYDCPRSSFEVWIFILCKNVFNTTYHAIRG